MRERQTDENGDKSQSKERASHDVLVADFLNEVDIFKVSQQLTSLAVKFNLFCKRKCYNLAVKKLSSQNSSIYSLQTVTV